jgi:hypothetical protein
VRASGCGCGCGCSDPGRDVGWVVGSPPAAQAEWGSAAAAAAEAPGGPRELRVSRQVGRVGWNFPPPRARTMVWAGLAVCKYERRQPLWSLGRALQFQASRDARHPWRAGGVLLLQPAAPPNADSQETRRRRHLPCQLCGSGAHDKIRPRNSRRPSRRARRMPPRPSHTIGPDTMPCEERNVRAPAPAAHACPNSAQHSMHRCCWCQLLSRLDRRRQRH